MPAARTLALSPEQRATLEAARDHHPRPYARERAAAILKVAEGWPVSHVAAYGLLKAHREETVSEWLDRYEATGLAALRVGKGRGRKPAFSPLGTL
jgi:transposase